MEKNKSKEIKMVYDLKDVVAIILVVILIGLILFAFVSTFKDGLEERTLDRCIKAKDAGLVLEYCKEVDKATWIMHENKEDYGTVKMEEKWK